MRDLVGEHPVLAELEHRVTGDGSEVLHCGEHVDGETLECPVDTGETKDRVGVARRFIQQGVLGEFAQFGAHVIGQHHRNFAVARLVPTLTSHVELQFEWHFALAGTDLEIKARSASTLQRLDFAGEDAMHQRPGTIGSRTERRGELGSRRSATSAEPRILNALGLADAVEPLVACQVVGWKALTHVSLP